MNSQNSAPLFSFKLPREMNKWWRSWWWIMLAGFVSLLSFLFKFLFPEVY
jgi:hypothetical protein